MNGSFLQRKGIFDAYVSVRWVATYLRRLGTSTSISNMFYTLYFYENNSIRTILTAHQQQDTLLLHVPP